MKEEKRKTIKERIEEQGIDLVGELLASIKSGELTEKEKADKVLKLIDLTTDKNEKQEEETLNIFIIDYREYDKDPNKAINDATANKDKYELTAINKPIKKPSGQA